MSLDRSRLHLAVQKSGRLSQNTRELLRGAGFRKVKNMTGGILRWSDEVDPSIPKY